MFIVYRKAGSVKYDMMGFNKEKDAIDFAESYNWSILDENEFEWDLCIEEEDGNADDYYISLDFLNGGLDYENDESGN